MSTRPRVVFDTSVLVGALLQPSSMPRRSILLARPHYEFCASTETMDELSVVLRRPKFDRYQPLELRLAFLAEMAAQSRLSAVDTASAAAVRGVCHDPAGAKFLALALAGSAEVLISGDGDLLELNGWNGVFIIQPAQFVEVLDVASDNGGGTASA